MNTTLITPQNSEKTLWGLNGLEQGRAIFLKEISDQAEAAKSPRQMFTSVQEAHGVLLENVFAVFDTARRRGGKLDLH